MRRSSRTKVTPVWLQVYAQFVPSDSKPLHSYASLSTKYPINPLPSSLQHTKLSFSHELVAQMSIRQAPTSYREAEMDLIWVGSMEHEVSAFGEK